MENPMTQPNILMIMDDQHHAACLGYRGHPDVKTPNLDKLAESGVRFDETFTCHGTCVPSRVSYMTGQYPHVHGIFSGEPNPIPERLLSLPAYLKPFGYRTALVGKKHMPHWPTHGFDYERVCYTADASTRGNHYYNYLKKHNLHEWYDDTGDIERFCLGEEKIPTEHSLENWTADETIAYLEQNDDRPFFLQTSFERPHAPTTEPPDTPFRYDPAAITLPENMEDTDSIFYYNRNVELKWRATVHGEEGLRKGLAAYYGLITLIDHNIGRILDALDAKGLRENTIIVFCADHGDFAGEYGRMAKGFPYDALHRIPYIWSWADKFKQGKIATDFASNVDFAPTICELLGLPIPKSLQGASLVNAMTTDADTGQDAAFYETICVKTIRTKTHKLSYGYTCDGEIAELRDLEKDPHEYQNFYDDPAYAAVREQLERRLLDWWIKSQQHPNMSFNDERLPETRWNAGG
jgi:arylsulfatase A-like enzyme